MALEQSKNRDTAGDSNAQSNEAEQAAIEKESTSVDGGTRSRACSRRLPLMMMSRDIFSCAWCSQGWRD